METIALLATIFAGLAAVYAVLFGSKPLLDAIRKSQKDADADRARHTQSPQLVSEPTSSESTAASPAVSARGDDMIVNDEFLPDEIAIEMLVNKARQVGHEAYNDVLTFQQRLLDNIKRARLYGDSNELRADRAQIINQLNPLALDIAGTSFNRLRLGVSPAKISPTESTSEAPPTPERRFLEFGHRITTYTLEIRQLVESSRYRDAAEKAAMVQSEVEAAAASADPDEQLSAAEFHVWHSHALIYTGQTELAAKLLRQAAGKTIVGSNTHSHRRDLIAGRAHNHIGYIHWMVNGDCEEALKEFALANSYFVSGGCHEENATALDNIGRVYAQLGHSSLAMLLIERGRTQRERLRLKSSGNYRYALSLHSSAVAHLGFGHPFRAAVLCKEAFDIFQSLQAKHGSRGVGLVLLTWGTTERYLSAFWKNRDHDRAERHLESAESYLLRAARIFGATDTPEPPGSTHPETRDAQIDKTVDEPIRLVQAYDELGCVYRERVVLSGSPDITQFAIARQMFHRAKEVAKEHGYGVLSADACEDLAKTYFRAGEYNEANRWLDEAEGDIPQSCRLSGDAVFRGCSEDFWQQLGKIHLLRGTIGMTSLLRTRSGNESAQEQLIRGVVEHYVFAIAYFDRFLTRPLDSENGWLYPDLRPRLAHHALFTEEILEELSYLKPDDLSLITQKILPSLYHDHEIPVKVQSFFTRGIEFLQHMSATSKPEGE